MAKGFSYADAAMLLGGSGPVITALDRLLGTTLTAAAAVGTGGALNLFDAKSETIRISGLLTTAARQQIHGAGRLDRTDRLRAAHSVLAVTAFFEAIDDLGLPVTLQDVEMDRAAQTELLGVSAEQGWVGAILRIEMPAPDPATPFQTSAELLHGWYRLHAGHLAEYLDGLAVVDRLNDTARHTVHTSVRQRLPEFAIRRYENGYLRLAGEFPEYAAWAWRAGATATTEGLRHVAAGLTGIESLLRSTGLSDRPDRWHAALAATYQAAIRQPIAGSEHDLGQIGDVVLPSLEDMYLDPRFSARVADLSSRPATDDWWKGTEVRDDLATFLAGHLTTPEATLRPLMVLGQPGSGKSALTKMLAARLPVADFVVVRVPLREVPVELDLQDQIEHAVRRDTGERISWPELVRTTGGRLPLVLLDGFDELLQATGVSQSDYLLKVAEFQEREEVLGRPVALVITSRSAVANRAQLPDGTVVVRLEPFDTGQVERWLSNWNTANAKAFSRSGIVPLTTEIVQRHPDLAVQPLLLLMLALYDAHDNALQAVDRSALNRSHLYEQLLTGFAEREIRKEYAGAVASHGHGRLVEHELTRLSIVSFAMMNRGRPWVTEQELETDLSALGMITPGQATNSFRAPQTTAQELVGRFFFVQRVQAMRDGRQLSAYEFLHTTFGEFLVARLTVRLLQDLTARENAGLLPMNQTPRDGGLQFGLLGFTPLSGQSSTVLRFVAEMMESLPQRRTEIRAWLLSAFRASTGRLDVPADPYLPAPLPIGQRLTRYGLNLMLLAIACGGEVLAGELFPDAADPADALARASMAWRSTLRREDWESLVDVLSIRRTWSGARREMFIGFAVGSPPFEAVDPYWAHGFGAGSRVWDFGGGRGFWGWASVSRTAHAQMLCADLGNDMYHHALGPLLQRYPEQVSAFAVHGPLDAESIAHSVQRALLSSVAGDPPEVVVAAFDRCVFAVTSRAWGYHPGRESTAAITLVLEMVSRDIDRLPPERVLTWLSRVMASPWWVAELSPPVLHCLALADEAGGPEIRAEVGRLFATLENDLPDPLDRDGRTARQLVLLENAVLQLRRGDEPAGYLTGLSDEEIESVSAHDRGALRRHRRGS
jgi:hypothetical protein